MESQLGIQRQVRRADQALLPTLARSFVACGRARVPHAPACKLICGVETLRKRVGHTHTTRTHLASAPSVPRTERLSHSTQISVCMGQQCPNMSSSEYTYSIGLQIKNLEGIFLVQNKDHVIIVVTCIFLPPKKR